MNQGGAVRSLAPTSQHLFSQHLGMPTSQQPTTSAFQHSGISASQLINIPASQCRSIPLLLHAASQHLNITSSQHPSVPASKHLSIPISQHPSISASHHPTSQHPSTPASPDLNIPAFWYFSISTCLLPPCLATRAGTGDGQPHWIRSAPRDPSRSHAIAHAPATEEIICLCNCMLCR